MIRMEQLADKGVGVPSHTCEQLRDGPGNEIGTQLLRFSAWQSQFRTQVPRRLGSAKPDGATGPGYQLSDNC
jgi:hypothetical protein